MNDNPPAAVPHDLVGPQQQIASVTASSAQPRDATFANPADPNVALAAAKIPAAATPSLERRESLERAIAQLPDTMQQVLLMRHRDNLSYHQIAQRLQWSDEFVRRQWGLAVMQLHGMLTP